MEVINTIGRRKTSVARVYMQPGKGSITVNNKDFTEYFPIDIMQGKGLRKHSGGQICSIEDIALLYVQREILAKNLGPDDKSDLANLNTMVLKSVLSEENVGKFWANAIDIIVERLTKRQARRRPFTKDADI